jgi:O-antigen ligase
VSSRDGAPLVPDDDLEDVVGPALLTVLAGAGLVLAAGTAVLAYQERYLFALVAVVLVPVGVALARRPVTVVAIWLAVAPLLMTGDGGASRRVFWLVHRGLPLAALGAIVLFPLLPRLPGLGRAAARRLPRLGFPEALMAGYLLATLASIALTSVDPMADVYQLYDRVAVPMVLYLIVRFAVDDRTLERWFPALAVLVISQAAFGIASWLAPDLLPDAWLNRAGSRTTGSLRNPNVYGISVMFGGVLALHLGRVAAPGSWPRRLSVPLFVAATSMAVLTLSRAVWLAVLVIVIGLVWLYPRALALALFVVLPLLVALVSTGLLGFTDGDVADRLRSEETALSRLPVVVASVRMFEERPLTGWGYNRFDDHDQDFQQSIDGVFVPTKDHASHNLHLTILAEQGLIGFVLYHGPAVVMLVRTVRRWPRIPRGRDRQLVLTLWLVLVGHLLVTSFSNMKVPFGLGVWWLSLALVALVLDRASPTIERKLSARARPAVTR